MTGEGLAAVIGSTATLIGVIGNYALQFAQLKISKSNQQKLNENSDKLDDVHAATTQIADATGTHKALDP